MQEFSSAVKALKRSISTQKIGATPQSRALQPKIDQSMTPRENPEKLLSTIKNLETMLSAVKKENKRIEADITSLEQQQYYVKFL